MKVFPFLFHQISKAKTDIFLSFLIMSVAMSCFTFIEYFYSLLLGFIGENPDKILSPQVYRSLSYMLGLSCLYCLLMGIMTFFEYRARIKLKKNILLDLFNVTHQHSNSYFDKEQTGTISTKITLTEQLINDFFFSLRGAIGYVTTTYILSFFLLYRIEKQLAFMIIGLCFFAILINVFLKKKLKNLAKETSSQRAKVIGFITDSLMNNRLVKNSASVLHERLFLRKHLNEYLRTSLKESKKTGMTDCQNTLNILVINLISLGLLLYFWQTERLNLTDFILSLTLLQGLIHPIHFVSQILLEYVRDYGKVEEALNMIYQPIQIKDKADACPLNLYENSIEFKNVSFSYGNEKQILNDLNLKIEPNQKIGIIGASGVGKSTLINLILRAIEPNSGSIFISNQDIAEIKSTSLRKQIAVINQDTALFNRSIFENIKTSCPKAGKEEVYHAAKMACIYDEILKMPNGFDSVIGDRGVKLSGGERQRICLASAILKNAPILILDEATSSLDSKSEKEIEKALKNIMQNKTVIAIAHRVSTLKDMDKILVLENGTLTEHKKNTRP